MSFRSIHRVWTHVRRPVAGPRARRLRRPPGDFQGWTGPGWYLEKPYLITLGGARYFGGPFSYDKCEEERIKLPAETATQMLCVEENRRPDRYGFF